MGKHLEIERRFLLKRMPVANYSSMVDISQCYVDEENGEFVRYRGQLGKGGATYFRTIKKDIEGSLVREENEEVIEKEEFIKRTQFSNKLISKKRHTIQNGDDTWEIDNFTFIHLINAEIEMPSKDYEFEIPEEIKKEIIMEITNIPEFNNSQLADGFERFS